MTSRAGEGDAAVRLSGVGKRFRLTRDRRTSLKELLVRGRPSSVDDFWALRDVSLSIPRGSVFGLIGHNGSGKSTLLKMIGGIYRPTTGSVQVDGRVASLIELGAGFHPDMTGRENVRLNGTILGLSRKEIDAAIGEIIEFSGIGDFIDEPVKTYSSGMYVRLGFSVAVHMNPDILLIDEVIAVGDEDFQRKCFDHLYGLRRAGRTIVLVSHSAALMSSLCDEIAWIDHGRVRQDGVAGDVVDAYLTAVNAAESVETGGEATRTSSPLRGGSGEARVASLALVDPDGVPMPTCVADEPLCIRMVLSSDQAVDDPVMTLAVRHESGAVVTVADSRMGGQLPGLRPGGTRVDYVQDRCWLNPGHYRLDVALYDSSGTRLYDQWNDALDLVVRPASGAARIGLVMLPGGFVTEGSVAASTVGEDRNDPRTGTAAGG